MLEFFWYARDCRAQRPIGLAITRLTYAQTPARAAGFCGGVLRLTDRGTLGVY